MNAPSAVQIAFATLAVFSIGCGAATLEDQLARYRDEVNAVVGGRSDDVGATAGLASLPGRRDRRIDSPDHRMNGFDFIAIQGCELARLVGERNSAMGRQMVPSQRLIYELRVIEAADACLETLGERRAGKLGGLIETKRGELPIHVWNAVWMGEEMEAFLASARHPIAAPADRDGSGDVARAARLIAGPIENPDDARALEDALGGLLRAEPAGALLRTLDRVASELRAVASLLDGRDPEACRGDAVTLREIFETRYLPLQAQLAAFDRNARDHVSALDALFAQSVAAGVTPSPAMRAYHAARLDPEAPDGLWQRYRGAVLQHVGAWGPTLRVCGLIPEGTPT